MPQRRQQDHGCPTLDQWFTPFWIAEELVAHALRGMGQISVCEPSCGNGAFLTAIPKSCEAFGVDIDERVLPIAMANSGREVLLGDFRTVDLTGREVHAVIGNPPFKMDLVDEFLDRAWGLLPDGGLVGMILPAYAFQTPRRVARHMERFSIDVNLIPRTIFPRISKSLVWAEYRKTEARTFAGLMLFGEQRDFELMRPAIKRALERPGTWREAVRVALESLGGEASLPAIYDRICPERQQASRHWQPKVRQILQLYFARVGEARWALAA
jgi:site-specific DNA-methyltransferase (adenine-specific)